MMDVLLPRTLDEAVALKAEHPEAVPIAGGTDLMVEINFDRRRPTSLIDLSRVRELATWRREDGSVFLGAGMTYARIVHDLAGFRPLVEASRTVGSPQIRNRATVGGNLGTASPAGDALPPPPPPPPLPPPPPPPRPQPPPRSRCWPPTTRTWR
jgi:CO/xanthine dehydrogenase FAD-binding subunit